MSTLIHRLRERPEHHRKAIAFGVSGGITLLLFLGWAITLPAQFGAGKTLASTVQGQSTDQSQQNDAIAGVAAAVPPTPSASISDVFNQGIQAFKDIGASFGTYFGHPTSNSGPGLQVIPPSSDPAASSQNVTPVSNSNSFTSNPSDGVVISDPTEPTQQN